MPGPASSASYDSLQTTEGQLLKSRQRGWAWAYRSPAPCFSRAVLLVSDVVVRPSARSTSAVIVSPPGPPTGSHSPATDSASACLHQAPGIRAGGTPSPTVRAPTASGRRLGRRYVFPARDVPPDRRAQPRAPDRAAHEPRPAGARSTPVRCPAGARSVPSRPRRRGGRLRVRRGRRSPRRPHISSNPPHILPKANPNAAPSPVPRRRRVSAGPVVPRDLARTRRTPHRVTWNAPRAPRSASLMMCETNGYVPASGKDNSTNPPSAGVRASTWAPPCPGSSRRSR